MSVFWKNFGLSAAGLFALVLVLQYPLSVTFPIGGDATRYIMSIQAVGDMLHKGEVVRGFWALITNNNYPATQLIFGISALMPLSWPDRFLWWMVLGHLATASAIGLLLYRLAGWQAAAVGIAGWSLATINLTRHIEDGTLAQLWSLAAVALFLYQAVRGSFVGMAALAAVAALLHPFSGLVVLLTFLIALPALIQRRRDLPARLQQHLPFATIAGALLLLAGLYVIWRSYGTLLALSDPTSSFTNLGIIKSPYGPLLVSAPLGFVLLFARHRNMLAKIVISSFVLTAALLTFNEVLGAGVLIHRFQSYFVLATTVLAGLGLPFLVRHVFYFRPLQTVFFVLLFASCGLATWHANIPIYAFYEGPSNNARIVPGAIAGIEWLRDNTSPDSLVVSTNTDRHSEWIPIISGLAWEGLPADHPLWHTPPERLPHLIERFNYDYVMFFLNREKPAERFEAGVGHYPVVFENNGAVILKLEK